MSARILPFGAAPPHGKRVGTVHRDGSVTFDGTTYRTIADVPESCEALRADVQSEREWRALYRAIAPRRSDPAAGPAPARVRFSRRPMHATTNQRPTVPRLNAQWHAANKMPTRATIEQRLAWHLEHWRHCACRKMPASLAAELKRRGLLD